jgi:SAM-dependent methyltransferase
MKSLSEKTVFDAFAKDYDRALESGLSLTGEGKTFFAEGRMHWLAKRLAQLEFDPESALDFGCGTGSATPYFFDILAVDSLIGIDVSAESLAAAVSTHGSERTRFCVACEFNDQDSIDLAFTNGVFHHIEPVNRAEALGKIFAALRPGGMFAFWENSPWNPGTRWIMSRVPFDRDAQMIWPRSARCLLALAGFEVLSTDFAFVFPGFLARLRRLEPMLCKLPLGGQYMVLARKPTR